MSISIALFCPSYCFDSSTTRTALSFSKFSSKISLYDVVVTTFLVTSEISDVHSPEISSLFDHVHFTPPNGIYPAFNFCIEISRQHQFDWIWIIGSGDTIIISESSCSFLAKELSISSTPISLDMIIGDRGQSNRYSRAYVGSHLNLDRARFNHPATIVPSIIYQEFGSYSLSYRTISDYFWFHTLLSNGVRPRCINFPSVYHELGGASTNSSKSALSDHCQCIHSLWRCWTIS